MTACPKKYFSVSDNSAGTVKYDTAAYSLPRKVVVGTIMHWFKETGALDERLKKSSELIDEVAKEAAKKYPGKELDLVVLPENAICQGGFPAAQDRAVPLEGKVLDTFSKLARQYKTYLIIAMMMKEPGELGVTSNVAVLLDRHGRVVGIYRKVHPVIYPGEQEETLEGGVMPGSEYPVFECDFGKIGIQICWDLSYEEGFMKLAERGAEIVVVCSASPQTIRTSSYALRGKYYVVTANLRNNLSVFNPIGFPVAQVTSGKVLVHEIDLAYAVVPWSSALDNGHLFSRHFGDKVGYVYSEREDRGVFWSNDPKTPIATMVHQLNLEMDESYVERCRRFQDSVRGKTP
jgi:predicted amidohydrolase